MAIAKMLRVFIFAPKKIERELIERIYDIGVAEIEQAKIFETGARAEPGRDKSMDKEEKEIKNKISRIESILNFLSKYASEKKSLVDSFFPEKIEIGYEIAEKLRKKTPGEIERIEGLRDALQRLRDEKTELIRKLSSLEPWKALRIRYSELGESESVVITLCSCSRKNFDNFLNEIKKATNAFAVIEACELGDKKFFGLIYTKKNKEKLAELFAKHNIAMHNRDFRDYSDYPEEEYNKIKNKISEIEKKEKKIENELRDIADSAKENLLLLYDELLIEYNKIKAFALSEKSKATIALACWIPAKFAGSFKKELEKSFGKRIEIFIREPRKNEKPPVAIENKLAEPFETVTQIYGMPSYNEPDPTPYLAPFFFIFFGFALGDAGYGMLLIILSTVMLKRVKANAAKKFFRLLTLAGIAAFIFGALTSAWFGNSFERFSLTTLASFSEKISVFNPIADPISALYIAIILGLIQLVFGTAIGAYKSFKEDKRQGIAKFAFTLLLISISALIFAKLRFAELLIIASLIAIAIFAGVKGLIAQLYELLGYIGDVLSYSRLLALGLATAVIAMVVNEFSAMFLSVPYVGIVLASLVFIFGHVFNLIISSLGAFIHSSRLQFVEFFGKFIEGGGKIFKPFRRERKYTVIRR